VSNIQNLPESEKTPTRKNTEHLLKISGINNYELYEFFETCPGTLVLLIKGRVNYTEKKRIISIAEIIKFYILVVGTSFDIAFCQPIYCDYLYARHKKN
jgi:hypothetical protein